MCIRTLLYYEAHLSILVAFGRRDIWFLISDCYALERGQLSGPFRYQKIFRLWICDIASADYVISQPSYLPKHNAFLCRVLRREVPQLQPLMAQRGSECHQQQGREDDEALRRLDVVHDLIARAETVRVLDVPHLLLLVHLGTPSARALQA